MKIFSAPVVVTFVAIVLIGLAVIYNDKKMTENESAPKASSVRVNAPKVSVIQASPNTYTAYVSSHGEAKAHWSLTLKSQVSGEVTSLNPLFKTGNSLDTQTVIATVDNTEYLEAIASAKADLADAQLALQEEKDLSDQAKREWERSGVTQEPSSPLVFRTLQLAAAQATADNAQSSLQTALRDEKNTHISTPFDAVVLTRDIDLGSYVSVGDTIATLNSSDKVEVFVPLSSSQFNNTNSDLSGDVTLKDIASDAQWKGYIDRVENHLDDTSRQRNIVVAIDKPFEQDTPLLPGTFVSVEMSGKSLTNVLRIPASAVTQDSKVWYVDEDNTLVSVMANIIFERGNYVYIPPIEGLDKPNIVIRPLVSYLSGMLVKPMVEE